MKNPANKKIIKVALNGFSWNMGGNIIRSLAGFVINILLARLLGPEPFGILAFVLLVINTCNLLIESGLGSALIQQKEIDNQDISFVFTFQIAFSIGLAVLIVIFAPWIAIQFASPSAAPVLKAASIILIFQAFAQVPSALLSREFDFKHIQKAHIISFLIGYLGCGLPLALLGFGVWSLVTANIVQTGLNALMVYFYSNHPMKLTLKASHRLTWFGSRMLAANIANWIIQYIDQLIVGHRFGATNLGFYSRAFFLSWTPVGIILTSVQSSLFSTVSRMGKNHTTTHIFFSLIKTLSIFFFSIYWLIALESTNIIKLIYGNEWMSAANLLTPLAFAMPLLALVGIEGPIINGLGKPQYEMKAQWITAIFAVLLLTAASTISLRATAWSILIINIIRLILMSSMTRKVLEISWVQLIRPIIPGFFMGIITIIIWNITNYLISFHLNDINTTIVRSFSVILVWIIVLLIRHKSIFPELQDMIRYIRKTKNGIAE